MITMISWQLTKIMTFLTANLSAFYLDFAKDVLYRCRNDKRRRGMQTVITKH